MNHTEHKALREKAEDLLRKLTAEPSEAHILIVMDAMLESPNDELRRQIDEIRRESNCRNIR